MFGEFFCSKRILVTGQTGFKGAWLSLWLKELGAEVSGFALEPPTPLNLHEVVGPFVFDGGQDHRGDIRNSSEIERVLEKADPEVIFHLAAQPIVRASYNDPLATLETNALGTARLLEALRRRNQPCTVIVVTTDKCYENREWEFAYRENDPLGGHDVYSMSKAAAELIANAWRSSFFQSAVPVKIRLATARAGNVIGGGDYAQDRIVPDAVAALLSGRSVPVRNPTATRPWQHVLECLSGYLWLAVRLAQETEGRSFETAVNFGPGPGANRSVGELVDAFIGHWPGGSWKDLSQGGVKQPHEAGRLNLAIDKANALLGWFPVWNFDETVIQTAAWYYARHGRVSGSSPLEMCRKQIAEYVLVAQKKRIAWAIS